MLSEPVQQVVTLTWIGSAMTWGYSWPNYSALIRYYKGEAIDF